MVPSVCFFLYDRQDNYIRLKRGFSAAQPSCFVLHRSRRHFFPPLV